MVRLTSRLTRPIRNLLFAGKTHDHLLEDLSGRHTMGVLDLQGHLKCLHILSRDILDSMGLEKLRFRGKK
jgi:hypothetical protein